MSCSKSVRFIVLRTIRPLRQVELLITGQSNLKQPVEPFQCGSSFVPTSSRAMSGKRSLPARTRLLTATCIELARQAVELHVEDRNSFL
jgi:hypothetical protein